MATKIQLRRDTAADWTSNNPTLAAGEFGYESDTTKFKIGDGSTAWNSLAYKTGEGFKVVADDSATITVAEEGTLYVQGGTNVTTSTDSAGVLTINATGEVTADSTTTFTNKTFDANGTGNSISNIETADIAAGTLVTAAEGIGSNDNDTTIPTSAAVKAYADSVGGGGASTGDITFTGSTIIAPSNANMTFETSGTGRYVFEALPSTITGNTRNDHGVVSAFTESIDASTQTASSDRRYYNTDAVKITLTGSGTDPDARYRGKHVRMVLDPAGYSITGTSSYGAGPQGLSAWMDVANTTGTSTVGDVTGIQAGVSVGGSGTTTVTNAYGNNAWLENYQTVTNNYLYQSWIDGNGSITNSYGYYYKGAIGGQTITNEYAFYDATNSLSVFGDIQTQAVSITDNLITTNRSNDDLRLSANGTGRIGMSTDGSDFWNNALYNSYYGNPNGVVKTLGVSSIETVDANTAARNYVLGVAQNTTLSGSSTSNSNFRQRTLNLANSLDMAGYSFTQASNSRGPKAATFGTNIVNTSSTASTLYTAIPAEFFCSAYADSSPYAAGDITITAPIGLRAVMELDSSGGAGNFTYTTASGIQSSASVHTNDEITTHYLFHARPGNGASGGTITTSYGYYVDTSTGGVGTNYAFYDASNSLSVFGDIQTQGVSITDNHITSNRSNDNLNIEANGTGQVELGAPFDQINTNTRYDYGVNMAYVNNSYAGNTRTWVNNQGHKHTLTQAGGSNFEINSENRAALEMAGFDATSGSRFFTSKQYNMVVSNYNSATAATLNNARSLYSGITASTDNGNLTLSDARGNHSYIAGEPSTGKTATITNSYNYYAQPLFDFGEGGTTSGTNAYGFYFASGSLATNTYAFYDAGNKLSRFGAVILANQASDPSTVTDSAHIYAKDVSSSSEVFVRDEAGNVTQISPHNEAGEWQYWSENVKTGKKVRVNMERMIRRLEEITGEKFIENE